MFNDGGTNCSRKQDCVRELRRPLLRRPLQRPLPSPPPPRLPVQPRINRPRRVPEARRLHPCRCPLALTCRTSQKLAARERQNRVGVGAPPSVAALRAPRQKNRDSPRLPRRRASEGGTPKRRRKCRVVEVRGARRSPPWRTAPRRGRGGAAARSPRPTISPAWITTTTRSQCGDR